MRFIANLILGMSATIMAVPAIAQPAFNETGWRPATGEEKAFRKIYEDAKFTWGKDDGKPEMYDCLFAWASMSNDVRSAQDDFYPTVAGDLSHAFTEGHLSHFANTLYLKENKDYEALASGIVESAGRFANGEVFSGSTEYFQLLGKCYVHPSSWNFGANVTFTGPGFSRDILQQDKPDTYPIYVRDRAARDRFDQLVLAKDFAGAANYAASLHSRGLKSTVYWHEVLEVSGIAASSGQGLKLDSGLLNVLSDVWWPKYRRRWAKDMLRIKRGDPDPNRPKLHDPGKEPAWAKLEYQQYRAGRTNYTPCNTWHRDGCN